MQSAAFCALIGLTLFVSSETACNLFSAIDDKLTLKPVKKEVYNTNDLIRFACPPGRKISGNHVITCHAHGWDGEPPVCIKPICHFDITIDAKLMLTPSGEGGYYDGELVTVSCPPGHSLIGTSLLRCGDSGWDYDPPVCLSTAELNLLEEVKRSSTHALQRLQAVQRSALKQETMMEDTKEMLHRINSRIDFLEKELNLLTSGRCQVRRGWELECIR